MANPFFRFKQFTVYHDRCAMKVTTDSCVFGAWAAREMQNEKPRNVLDIGTGTALLSLMIAQQNDCMIDAVEIEESAAKQASENVAASPWAERISIHQQDILAYAPAKKFDCIICNPPFYESELASSMEQKNMAHHSSHLTIRQLLNTVRQHLNESGSFFLLYPFKRHEEMQELFGRNGYSVEQTVFLKQSVRHNSFRVLVKMKLVNPASQTVAEISVWDEQQQYTPEFVALLKDYYLYL